MQSRPSDGGGGDSGGVPIHQEEDDRLNPDEEIRRIVILPLSVIALMRRCGSLIYEAACPGDGS